LACSVTDFSGNVAFLIDYFASLAPYLNSSFAFLALLSASVPTTSLTFYAALL
jgi:hypothetical protein